MSGGIKCWPEAERPREKLMQRGVSALSDAELLALILRCGDAACGRSALDLGRDLMLRFKSLRCLADASCSEIQQVKGIGPAKATCVLASLDLARRIRDKEGRPIESFTRFTSASQVFEHLNHEFRDRHKEQFLALLLDGKNRIISRALISEGSARGVQRGGAPVGGGHDPAAQPPDRRSGSEPRGCRGDAPP